MKTYLEYSKRIAHEYCRSFRELSIHPRWVSRYVLVSLMFKLFSGFSRQPSTLSHRLGDLTPPNSRFFVGQRSFRILLIFIHSIPFFGFSGFGLFSSTATPLLFLLFCLLLMDSLGLASKVEKLIERTKALSSGIAPLHPGETLLKRK